MALERGTIMDKPHKRLLAWQKSMDLEGAAGRSVTQFRNFLSVAIGSLNEISTQLEIAYRVGYLDRRKLDAVESRVNECLALTYGLRESLIEE